jgi:hypothetical protein
MAPVVLDDEVAADRLDVDGAAALLVGERARGAMAAGARLVVGVRQLEEPSSQIDRVARQVQCRSCASSLGHAILR